MTINLSKLTTEQSNEHSTNIDSMSILEIIELMNAEDRTVAEAVKWKHYRKFLPRSKQSINH